MDGYFLNGLFRGRGDRIGYMMTAYCCRPGNHLDRYGSCYDENVGASIIGEDHWRWSLEKIVCVCQYKTSCVDKGRCELSNKAFQETFDGNGETNPEFNHQENLCSRGLERSCGFVREANKTGFLLQRTVSQNLPWNQGRFQGREKTGL